MGAVILLVICAIAALAVYMLNAGKNLTPSAPQPSPESEPKQAVLKNEQEPAAENKPSPAPEPKQKSALKQTQEPQRVSSSPSRTAEPQPQVARTPSPVVGQEPATSPGGTSPTTTAGGSARAADHTRLCDKLQRKQALFEHAEERRDLLVKELEKQDDLVRQGREGRIRYDDPYTQGEIDKFTRELEDLKRDVRSLKRKVKELKSTLVDVSRTNERSGGNLSASALQNLVSHQATGNASIRVEIYNKEVQIYNKEVRIHQLESGLSRIRHLQRNLLISRINDADDVLFSRWEDLTEYIESLPAGFNCD